MNQQALTALRGSIAHWENNLAAKSPAEVSTRWRDCPLCVSFIERDEDWGSGCRSCPVYAFTGEQYCHETPFEAAENALENWSEDMPGSEADWQAAAQAELDFLKSLLPSEAKS